MKFGFLNVQNCHSSDDKSDDDVKNLVDDMENLIDSVKDYK